MSETVLTSRSGKTGVITLNRPEAINALDMGMIRGVAAAFADFSADASVEAIILEGAGTRGFCAGGDVRAVRQAVLDGDMAAADGFFEEEYALNAAIAESRKPVVALTDGVVMGGGIGLAGHAQYRIATDRVKFAMPESAIGFVCDVGVDAIMAKAPVHRALAFLMTGLVVGAADALALGLTDCVVPHDRMSVIREELFAAIAEGDVPTSIVNVMQANGVDAGETVFVAQADRLETAFLAGDAAQIFAALAAMTDGNKDAKAVFEILKMRCPTSLVAIEKSHMAARNHGDIARILAVDLAMARWMVRQADFAEGVRAVLVDKDQAPVWAPLKFEDVDITAINSCLAHL